MSFRIVPILSLILTLVYQTSTNAQDYSAERAYQGYRLHLTGIKILDLSENNATVSLTAVNTGKYPVDTKEGEHKALCVLNFDPTAIKLDFLADDGPYMDALFKRSIQLDPGDFIKIPDLQIQGSAKDIPLPIFNIPEKTRKDSIAADNAEGDKETEVTTVDTIKKKSSDKEKNGKEIILIAPEVDRRPIEELLEEKNTCPDLVFDTLKIIKQTDRTAWVEFTIKNIGKGPAELYNNEEEERPFGIRAFISGSTFISKGSVTIGGHTIDKGLGETVGILNPGEEYKETIQVDIRQMTRYMPVLILSIDAFLKLRECDRTNNTSHIIFE